MADIVSDLAARSGLTPEQAQKGLGAVLAYFKGSVPEEDFAKATEGQRTIRRGIGCVGADDPTLRVLIAFFDSKEDAEVNSQLPGTDQIASKVMGMIKEDMPEFINLEVKSDRTF